MPDINMNINRQPQQQPRPMNEQVYAPAPQSGSRLPWVILTLVILAAIVILGWLFRDKLHLAKSNNMPYKAVFLTNGQVYFGKLSDANDDYVTLKDIYYLQVNQALQQGQTQTNSNQQPQLSLVKLGSELHGPVDEMKINRDQVLFYEEIKNDGKVAEAIAAYKANPNQTPAQTQTPATQAPATTTPATTK
jgi:hypothetical protein